MLILKQIHDTNKVPPMSCRSSKKLIIQSQNNNGYHFHNNGYHFQLSQKL